MNLTQTSLFNSDLSFDLSINKGKYSEQDYVRVLNRCGELEKKLAEKENKIKELETKLKLYNSISRRKK